jgi:stringent starvation protein B
MLPPTAKPYLVRAIYDWCVDEGQTPYLLVAAAYPGVRFPNGYDRDGRLTLNIAPKAVERLELGPDRIRFLARFGGAVHGVEVPVAAVIAVFAAESHDGVVFGEPPAPAAPLEEVPEGAKTEAPAPAESPKAEAEGPEPPPPADEPDGKPGGPRLRLVK